MKTLVLLAFAATGCDVFYEPDVGDPFLTVGDAGTTDGTAAIPGCSNADSDPATPVSLKNNIRPLMTRSPGGCMPCHLGRVNSGLDLSSYESLRRGGQNSGTRIIVPGEPCNSILPKKISRTPPFGSRMPFNGPPYFTIEEQQLVRDWVAEGALNN